MPVAVKNGIDIRDFWEYTLGEISTLIEIKQQMKEEEEKNMVSSAYLTASLTASFVSKALNGKNIPVLYDLFPNIFPKPEMDWRVYEAQFMSFAEQHNKQRGVR